jgi:hypothetical protein
MQQLLAISLIFEADGLARLGRRDDMAQMRRVVPHVSATAPGARRRRSVRKETSMTVTTSVSTTNTLPPGDMDPDQIAIEFFVAAQD